MFGKLLDEAQYRLARRIAPDDNNRRMDGSVYDGKSKLQVLLGTGIVDAVRGKRVTDFLRAGETFDSRGLPVPRPPGKATLLGAAPWVYREALEGSWAAVRALCGGRTDDAFTAECRVREALGQLAGSRERWRAARARP